MTTEVWKTIEGFDKYQVSNLARVRNTRSGYLIKQRDTSGYITVKLTQTGSKDKRVSILVAQAFLPPPEKDKIIVNHKDGNKLNNSISNLEWMTVGENTQHARDTGLLIPFMRKVYKLDPNTNEILHMFKSIREFCEKMKSHDTTIMRVSKNKSIYKGFKWSVEERPQKNIVTDSIWKPFRNSNYHISNCGQVKNNNYGRILKHEMMSNGYERCKLLIKGKLSSFFIHRAVAEVFIPNPNNLPYVDHIDNNPLNNHVSNLRWTSHSDNTRYACAISVDQLDLQGNFIKTWHCMADAEKKYGSGICWCAKGNLATSGGFKWRYTDEKLRCPEYIKIGSCKSIDQLDLQGNFIKNWPSIASARLVLPRCSGISLCLNGKCKTAGGFKWRYSI